MFLQLNHQKLELFKTSKAFVLECYKKTRHFPTEEKFAMVQQMRNAARSVHLNIGEGCSRRSEAEHKRFFEISRGSIIEVDTALEIAVDPDYTNPTDLEKLSIYLLDCFKMLSSMITKSTVA